MKTLKIMKHKATKEFVIKELNKKSKHFTLPELMVTLGHKNYIG